MSFKPTLVFASMVAAGALFSGSAFASHHNYAPGASAMQNHFARMASAMFRNYNGVDGRAISRTGDWTDHIHVGGRFNVDLAGSDKGMHFLEHGRSDITVNNADIFIDGAVNQWVGAHATLSYQEGSMTEPPYAQSIRTAHQNDSYEHPNFGVEEAYIDVGCPWRRTVVLGRFGRQFINFSDYTDRFGVAGDYLVHPIVQPLTQILSQTTTSAATVGFVHGHWSGSAFVFDGIPNADNDRRRLNNYGFAIAYDNRDPNFGYGVNASYMRNLADVDYISGGKGNTSLTWSETYGSSDGTALKEYNDCKVPALAFAGYLNFGAFFATAHYVNATTRFSSSDITHLRGTSEIGAKPCAYDILFGYMFMTFGHHSTLTFSYEGTSESEGSTDSTNPLGSTYDNPNGLYLPEHRYMAEYDVTVLPNTDVGVALFSDRDYSAHSGGTGRCAAVGILRLSVMFT